MADLGERVAAMGARSRTMTDERRAALVAEQADKAAQAEVLLAQLRCAMPVVAAVVDELREAFGEGVRVLAAAEAGKSVFNRRLCDKAGVDWRGYEKADV